MSINNEPISGIPIHPPAVFTEDATRALRHVGSRIPQSTLDLFAAILFDKRDEWPRSAGMSGRQALQTPSPLLQKMRDGALPIDEQVHVAERAAKARELSTANRDVYNVEGDLVDLMRAGARLRDSTGRPVFYMHPSVVEERRTIRRRLRRKKRRARYNRGKTGVRPRHRCAR